MCLTKIPKYGIFKLLVVIFFSKYVHCDMRFLVENISALFCFLDGLGMLFQYSVIRNIQLGHHCIMTVPDCGLPNGTKLSNLMNYW